MKTTILFGLLVVATQSAVADIIMTVNPIGSATVFSIPAGYTVAVNPANSINTSAITDNTKWNQSNPNFGSTGYAVIGSHYETGQAPEIEIILSGLNAGSKYDIFGLVFTNTGLFPGQVGSPAYGSKLGLAANSLTTFSHSSGGTLIALGDTTAGAPVGQYEIREFHIGIEQATTGSVSVFMDDFNGGLVTGNLAGLRLAQVPEPSTIALAAMAFVILVACRVKKTV